MYRVSNIYIKCKELLIFNLNASVLIFTYITKSWPQELVSAKLPQLIMCQCPTYINRQIIQKENSKETQTLNDTLVQTGLTEIYRALHLKAEYTSFSTAQGIFSRTDHMLSNKRSSVNLRNLKSLSSIFSDHNAMRLEINYKGHRWWSSG